VKRERAQSLGCRFTTRRLSHRFGQHHGRARRDRVANRFSYRHGAAHIDHIKHDRRRTEFEGLANQSGRGTIFLFERRKRCKVLRRRSLKSRCADPLEGSSRGPPASAASDRTSVARALRPGFPKHNTQRAAAIQMPKFHFHQSVRRSVGTNPFSRAAMSVNDHAGFLTGEIRLARVIAPQERLWCNSPSPHCGGDRRGRVPSIFEKAATVASHAVLASR
jgi:hypothetical protein